MKSAAVTYVHGLQFVGVATSGHAVVMDGDPDAGGQDTAPRPTELLLMSIGGCSGMDVLSILRKKRQNITGLEIQVTGEQADSFPRKFIGINMEFAIRGKNISEEAVKKAVDLSLNKYCSVTASLDGSAKLAFSYKIVEEQQRAR